MRPDTRTMIDLEIVEQRQLSVRLKSATAYRSDHIEYEITNVNDDSWEISRPMGEDYGTGKPGLDIAQTHELPTGSYVLRVRFGDEQTMAIPFDLPADEEPLVLEVIRD